ncbi:Bug family tripartite tricarboxylate transporter substrate binding protein [Hydrogenophaga sp. BPS33]|uniref:Bug family tripartite tricarboxylate transporter substrate binding protein n=1 Tax=Hydrogenophaga sp. BPS33 TaxID=2651974 RepID=UPI00131F5216|nr:tripartite tricarboxylate transporter substrate binding protein [Hydrogenophaga sp. BPS33]QHE83519.1 tripartite tricarboxylate transporter substrate binding protein [Hydrogenophaga sp. BPS33]
MKFIRPLVCALFAGASIAMAAPAAAAFPEKPVHIVIPYTAGAGTDVMFRQVVPYLEKELGAKVVIDNRPGASGNIGNEFVARATPDGYTLLVNSINVLLSPMTQKDVRYSVERSFVPISRVVTTQMLMVSHVNTPFKTLPEFVRYTQANPNKLNFGASGVGTPPDLLAEILRLRVPTPFVMVPYKGMSGAMADLVGGSVDFTFTSSVNIKQFIDSGKLRPVAVTGEKRSTRYPEVPTFKELGVDITPLDAGSWWGMFAPTGTPEPVVRSLSEALARALANPELVQKLAEGGYTPTPDTPQAYTAQLQRETEIWKQVVPSISSR